jgi:phosphate starvation-inducible protein PhoH and related proteins
LGISALTPPPRSEDVLETRLEFPDNRLLIDLCGEFDRNLARIEQKTGVHILRKGNQLAVMGEAGPREQAVEVLKAVYARLEDGRGLEDGRLDATIRMGAERQTLANNWRCSRAAGSNCAPARR